MPYTPEQYAYVRQRARTDLLYLCNNLLGYKDVCREVHGSLLDSLQKFQGGTDVVAAGKSAGQVALDPKAYVPKIELWQLEGPRKCMILMPRGHLKTTVATIAYCIQWIINYPNIRILVSSGTGDQVRKFLSEIKSHFQFGEFFRYFFPEFCPHGKNVKEFGNQETFTVPCRSLHRKEPTVSTCSVGAVVAGGHFEVILNDDIVDKENVRTPEQIANVKSHYGFLWPLVETNEKAPYKGWMQLTGTRYDFSDIYGQIIDSEKENPTGWKILALDAIVSGELSEEPCSRRDCGVAGAHKLIDHCVSLWPSRVPPRALKEILDDPMQGPGILASQYRMNPIPAKSGLVESAEEIVWIPLQIMRGLYAQLSLHVTVDLAGMETGALADNDYTVITPHGFGRDGTLYVLPIIRGRMTPREVIDQLFMLMQVHPRIRDIKIEKEAHWRVLKAFVMAEQQKRGKWLPLMDIQRDNRTAKKHRIQGLQPWFKAGRIKFQDHQPHKLAIINEIMRFPKYIHDDILDTIADAMQNSDGGVNIEVMPAGRPGMDRPERNPGPDLRYLEDRIWGQNPEEQGLQLQVDPLTGF